MANRRRNYRKTAAFLCEGKKQFVTVETSGNGQTMLRRCGWHSKAVLDELACLTTGKGCGIEGIDVSPSGAWLVTLRHSGQGEWGYDVVRTCPLTNVAGTPEERGYMLDLPKFSDDETRLVGGFGERWLGGWWAHPDDDCETPARGGVITFGTLFVHHLPSHKVERHELRMNLPQGWVPRKPEAEVWYAARDITPTASHGVRLVLPGGASFEIDGPLPKVILLPTPDPASGQRGGAAVP